MNREIDRQLPAVRQACAQLGVRELALFGSVTKEDFRPESDVDVLVEFGRHTTLTPFEQYFELKERLEEVFGRRVDLVTRSSLRNPIFRKEVEQSRSIVHGVSQTEAAL